MPRSYRLQRRADRQADTRRRIVEAAVELHASLGPAKTTISAIAERAGVQRLTVYRHFPDERALLEACSTHWALEHPAPDPEPWTRIEHPATRLKAALSELYAHYRENEQMYFNLGRDTPSMPVLQELQVGFLEYWAAMRAALLHGWTARGRQRRLLEAAIGHALAFATWRSLVREQGLEDDQAIEAMVALARALEAG